MRKHICQYCLVAAIVLASMPAMAGVALTPAGARIYGYAESLQGSEGVFSSENEWDLLTGPMAEPSVSAENDPLDPGVDPLLLDGLSSFAVARSSLTDPDGWEIIDNSDTFHLFVNNQATQDPGGCGGIYGSDGWGYSVAYMMVTYDTIPTGDSSNGDQMTVTIDLDFAEELYADGWYAEYFLEVGYALGAGLIDYNPVLSDPANQANPGLGQFDGYVSWADVVERNAEPSYEEAGFSDSLIYEGVIGDQVQVLIALSSFSYSHCGYTWTRAILNPAQGSGQAQTQHVMSKTTPELIPRTSLRAVVAATTPTAPGGNVFGPNQYFRTRGKPNLYTATFLGTSATGRLIVINGEENSEHRVASAIIRLNGQEVLAASNLNQNIYNLDIAVDLGENNQIVTELRGEPGSYITVQVVQ